MGFMSLSFGRRRHEMASRHWLAVASLRAESEWTGLYRGRKRAIRGLSYSRQNACAQKPKALEERREFNLES